MSTPVQKLFDLDGQTALVTGGSRGLGLQIAEALGEAGAKIMLTSRKAADLEEAGRAAAGQGHRRALDRRRRQRAGDIGARGRPKRMERMGRIDILVNNAGATWGAPAERPSARGLGQGDEPQHPQPLPVRPGDRQGEHDSAQAAAASSTSRRSPAWAAIRRT